MDELTNLIVSAIMKEATKNTACHAKTTKCESKTEHAKKLAQFNKMLFDAHIEAGFTAEQAIQLISAVACGR